MQNFRKETTSKVAPPQSADLDDMPNCFTSFMGSGSLPFDIQGNLFSEEGNSRADTSGVSEGESEGKPIEVISRRKEENNFDITNFLKNLAQGAPSAVKPNSSASIPGLGDPLPVPPPPIPSDYQLPSSPSSVPIPPPPMPPNLFDNYSQDIRDRDDSWNTSLPPKFPTWRDTADSNWSRDNSTANDQDGGDWMPALPVPKVPPPPLPQNLETPESPPSFEKESFREPVEYDETDRNRSALANSDVDHRTFMGRSSSSPKDVDHRILNSRFKKDVDHRNLISLTGSPRELQPPPLPPNLWGDVDQDYRTPPISRQQARPDDNVESVDMEMSDEEEIERHQDKRRSRSRSPSRKLSSVSQSNVDSPNKDRDDLGKMKSPHSSAPSKLAPQRFSLPPPGARPPFPPLPPRPVFTDGQFPPPGMNAEFSNFNNPNRFPMPIPPPPAIPLSAPPPGIPLRMRHPGLNLLPNITLPPNPLIALRSPVPSGLAGRSLEMSPPPSLSAPNSQVTPSGNSGGTHSSGPEESDTDSMSQYLNMGLSDDEEIKEMVASMDPQLLQEVVDGINIGNGSDKIDLSSFMPSNGEVEENDNDWSSQNDFVDPSGRGGPRWKPTRQSVGTPPNLGMPHSPMPSGAPRFRGHAPNWRSPPVHDRGGGMGRGRGWNYRQFRGRGPHMPRAPYGGNW